VAKLPDATAFGQRPDIQPGGRRQTIALPGGEGLAAPIRRAASAQAGYAAKAGEGLESLADAAYKTAIVNERLLAVRRGAQVDSAVTRAAADMKVFVLDLKNDPDVETYGKRFEERSKKISEVHSKGLDKQGLAEFQGKYESLLLDQALKVREIGNTKLIDQSVAALDQNLEETAQLASRSNSKTEYDKLVTNGVVSVDKMVRAGIISAVDGGKRVRAFQGRLDEVKVLQMISDNPGQATQMLANPKMFTHLDPLRRESLTNSAVSRSLQLMNLSNAINDRNERLAEKKLKQQSDLAAKDGWDLWRQGGLTADWLDQNKPRLDQGDYVALTKAFTGEDGRDNPAVVADLTERLTTQDIVPDAGRALANRDITVNTYESLVGKNRSALADDRPASPYKSARTRVQVSLDPGQLLVGPAASAGKVAQQNAMAEFDAWAEANPQADRTAYQQEAEAVVKRYQVIGFEQMSLTQGLPRFFTGTRDSLSVGDIDAAERQALEAFDNGKFTRDQLTEELQKIKNWRGILTMKGGNTSPKPTGRPNAAKPQ
jgi:hypothetical protein